MKHAPDGSRTRPMLLLAPLVLLAFALNGCAAATRPADPSAPRANEAPYPVLLEAGEERRERALANWAALVVGVAERDAAPRPELQPVTATVAEIPALPAAQLLRLPRVFFESETTGATRTPTDEELRESLRRFVASASVLLGIEPRDLSLVEITDVQGGERRALYQQKPFAHPLRNGYGEVSVTFTPDLVVTSMSSTAIPDAEPLRRALAAIVPQLSAEAAVAALAGQTVTATNQAGATETRAITSTEATTAREMVVYPRALAEQPGRVELRLAWEVAAGAGATPLLVYVDAVTGDILAARVSS